MTLFKKTIALTNCLSEIYDFIFLDSAAAADRILLNLQRRIEALVEYP